MGLTIGMALKFYTSVTKGLKLKVRKFLGLIPIFVEIAGEKLVERDLFGLPSRIGLKKQMKILAEKNVQL